MKICIINVVVIAITLISTQTFCQEDKSLLPVSLLSDTKSINITDNVEYLDDGGRQTPFEKIKIEDFKPLKEVFGDKKKAFARSYWIKFDAYCTPTQDSCFFYLNNLDFIIYEAYQITKNDTIQTKKEIGFRKNNFTSENAMIPIRVKNGELNSFYVYIFNFPNRPQKPKMELLHPSKAESFFWETVREERGVYAFYVFILGLILFLVVSNIFIYSFSRESVYLIYVLFLTSQFLSIQGHFEYEFFYSRILLHQLPALMVFYLHQNLTCISCIFYILFIRSFFYRTIKDTYIYRNIQLSLKVFIIILCTNIFFMVIFDTSTVYQKLHEILLVVTIFNGLFAFIFILRIKNPLKNIIVSGILLFYLCRVISYIVSFFPVANDDVIIWNSTTFYTRMSVLLEIFFFSIGLGFRAFVVKLEKEILEENKRMSDEKIFLYERLTHEFRSPLTIINANAELLLKREQSKLKKENSLKAIIHSSKFLERTVSDFLELSKMEYKDSKNDFIQSDIILYVKEIVEIYVSIAVENRISLSFNSDVKELIVDFIPNCIQQILVALIENAIKFTPAYGQIKVTISVGKGVYSIFIADTGIGIPQDEVSSIFQKFYRSSNAKQKQIRGTGLGLSIVELAVKMNRGTITVDTSENKGTAFNITFRITSNAQHRIHITEKYFKPLNTSLFHDYLEQDKEDSFIFNKKTVLIVEDDILMANTIKEILREKKYYFLEARNGKAGLFLAQENKPDIIITDEMMPELTGFEMVKQLKEQESTKAIPIIMLTARVSREYEIRSLKLKIDAYLKKPIDIDFFLLTVEKVLHNNSESIADEGKIYWDGELVIDEYQKSILEIIEDNYQSPDFTVNDLYFLVRKSEMVSPSTTNRRIKSHFNLTPAKLLKIYRLKKAQKLLKDTTLSHSQVIDSVGLSCELSNFSRMYSEYFKKSPSEERN